MGLPSAGRGGVGCLQSFQGNALGGSKTAAVFPGQVGYIAADAQGRAQVVGQGAHIHPPPALHFQSQQRQGKIRQLDVENVHRAGFPLHLNAGPGQFIEPLPLHLDRAIHRRGLFNGPDKGGQSRLHNVGRQPGRIAGFGYRALGVISGTDRAQAHYHPVAFHPVHHIVHQAGGLAETDRQHALGQGIHRPAVADFLPGAGQALNPPQGVHGSHSHRLVKVHKAVEGRGGVFPLARHSD